MGCPDDAAVLAFTSGDLGAGELDDFDRHLDSCDSCQELVAALSSDDAGPDAEVVALTAGTSLGRYRIDQMIGRGATGRVYRARDDELEREVAIKVLVAGSGEQLLAEAQAMARLQHPNVVAVHDVGREGERVYLAMEHIAGGSLRDWLSQEREPSKITEVFAAIADGLQAAHDADLVHGDFKPDNVVIDETGRARITDFGLAPWASSPAASDDDLHATRTAGIVGTPAYMAPEQWAGQGADARSDQFSFCVALTEALTGERPFAGDDAATLETNVRAGRAQLDPQLPARIARVVRRGLATEPAARFPSMAAVAAELRARPVRRWPLMAAAAVALAALAVIAIDGLGADRQVDPTPVAESPADRRVRPELAEAAEVLAELDGAEELLAGGHYDRAEDAVHRVLAGKPTAHTRVRAWLLQAAISGQKGDYKGARRAVDVASSSIADVPGDAALHTDLVHAQGLVALGTGQTDRALERFGEALRQTRAVYGDGHPHAARALSHIGLARKASGDLDGALEAHRQALALDQRNHGAGHLRTARHHHNLGGVLRVMMRFDEAREHYHRALEIRKAAQGDEHPLALMTVNSLGLVELDEGDLAAARALFEKAEAGLAQAGDGRRARALTNLAIVAERQNRRADSRRLYRQARQLWIDNRGSDHQRVASIDAALTRLKRAAGRTGTARRKPTGEHRKPKTAGPAPRDRRDQADRPTPSYGSTPTWTRDD